MQLHIHTTPNEQSTTVSGTIVTGVVPLEAGDPELTAARDADECPSEEGV